MQFGHLCNDQGRFCWYWPRYWAAARAVSRSQTKSVIRPPQPPATTSITHILQPNGSLVLAAAAAGLLAQHKLTSPNTISNIQSFMLYGYTSHWGWRMLGYYDIFNLNISYIQGVYINCQKLMSLLWGKYQLDIVYFGNFVLHMSSHLSTTCEIPPTMKKSLNITSWRNGWFLAWAQNGAFSNEPNFEKLHLVHQIKA